MTSITLIVTGASICAEVNGMLTSGMVGIPVFIQYDKAWNGLTKNLVCRCGKWDPTGSNTRTILNVGETAVVAHEVMQAKNILFLGIEGYSADGSLVMPTAWANCGYIYPGANANVDSSAAPMLPIWAQLQTMIGDLDKLDTDAKANLVEAINETAQNSNESNVDLAGYVKSVNGKTPNENGNVEITIPDSSQNVDYANISNKPKINGVELAGDKSLEDLGIGIPTDAQVLTAVYDWLDEHPDATTTVQDGSITPEKLTDNTKNYLRGTDMPNVVLFGDSITTTSVAYRGEWVRILQERLSFKSLTNYAHGGALWMLYQNSVYHNAPKVGHETNSIWNQYNRMVSDIENNVIPIPNAIVMMAGINDLPYFAESQTVDDAWSDTVLDKNVTTFVTQGKSIRYVCELIMRNFPNTQIILCTPTQVYNGVFPNRILKISQFIRDCANRLGVTLIDANGKSGIYNGFEGDASTRIYTTDGIHLSQLGDEILARFMYREFISKIRMNSDVEDVYAAKITGISATYDVTHTVSAGDAIRSLLPYITVVATYADGTEKQIPYFGISGDLSAVGQSVVTLDYSTKTATITVTVTDGTSEPDEPEEPEVPDAPVVTTYSITNNLTNVTTNNNAASVTEGTGYTATLAAANGYNLDTVTVYMGGVNVTATAYSNGVVSIASVTGNVVITATATQTAIASQFDGTWESGVRVYGTYVYTTGNGGDNFSTTDYVPTDGYTKVVCDWSGKATGIGANFYDASKDLISYPAEMVGGANPHHIEMEFPEGTAFVRMCATTEFLVSDGFAVYMV